MTSLSLKIIALILMTIDHIGAFIPGTLILIQVDWKTFSTDICFLLCVVYGFHEKSKKIYDTVIFGECRYGNDKLLVFCF